MASIEINRNSILDLEELHGFTREQALEEVGNITKEEIIFQLKLQLSNLSAEEQSKYKESLRTKQIAALKDGKSSF